MNASVASVMAPGLVSYSTSPTDNKTDDGTRLIDTAKSRIAKMQRAVMKGTQLHGEYQSAYYGKQQAIMATLTYRKSVEPAAKHISKCMDAVNKWFARKYGYLPKIVRPQLRYTWVAELTRKGKLHYHVLFFLPPGRKLPMFDRSGFWKHGMTKLEFARHASAYMAKYASKGGNGKKLPKGFRMHGSGGFTKDERAERRYHLAPAWVRLLFSRDMKPKPCHGGGWFSPVTGEFQSSPFFLLSAKAGRVRVGVFDWFAAYLSQMPQEGDTHV